MTKHARISIDLRIVHKNDFVQGIGARNVDNAARSDARMNYALNGQP